MEEATLSERLPTVTEYIDLRTRMGWGRIDEETANRTIQSAAFTVGLRRQDQLVVGPRDGRWRDVFLSG